jgi:ubiquitin carboxyl-terminal hydrolase 22/27/51
MRGLWNNGNICYFNSCLQCILQIPLLSNSLMTRRYHGTCEFTQEYIKFVREFWSCGKQPCDPYPLLKLFCKRHRQFNTHGQHDAHEVFVSLLDILHKGTRQSSTRRAIDNPEWRLKSNSLIKEAFYSQIEKTITYPGGSSVTRENTGSILLTPTQDTSLLGLVEDFTREETIEGYRDSTGVRHRSATLTQKLIHKAPILVFCFNMFLKKVNVSIPEKFGNYKLISCCLHMGGQARGHYVSYTLHKDTWYLKDDDRVVKQKPSLNSSYYFCIYKSNLTHL